MTSMSAWITRTLTLLATMSYEVGLWTRRNDGPGPDVSSSTGEDHGAASRM